MATGDDMVDKLDRLGGSLINLVLGALILWVGQTTFKHAGVLASVDEKLAGVNQQFAAVDKRHESMRKWLESVVNDMKDSTRSQFTMKDGDKLVAQVRQSEVFTGELERRIIERLSALEVALARLEVQHRDTQHATGLELELARLRGDVGRLEIARESQIPSAERVARQAPVYLPPVDSRR